MEILAIWAISVVFSMGIFALWLWSLIDAIQNAKNKVLWVLIIILLSFLGSILWWVMGERESRAPVRPRTMRRRSPRGGIQGRVARRPRRGTLGTS
jgi:hypothetical protein